MGYTTITTGTVIATSWGNEVRDQVVTPFPTSADRDATILPANRKNGQVAALTNANVNHGLTVWNGSSWTRPWNLPWGLVTFATASSNTNITSTTSGDVSGITTSASYIATRYYQAQVNIPLVQVDTAAVTTKFWLTKGDGTIIATLPRVTIGAVDSLVYSTSVVFTTSTISQVIKLKYEQSGSNSVAMQAASCDNAQLVIMDIGPSGAPA